jgi:hypothetical protein
MLQAGKYQSFPRHSTANVDSLVEKRVNCYGTVNNQTDISKMPKFWAIKSGAGFSLHFKHKKMTRYSCTVCAVLPLSTQE